MQRTKRKRSSDWENARLGEDARWRGKGLSLGRRVNREGRGREGVEADAHRVPTVNVDYTRALNSCACIRERTLDLAFPKERIEKRPRKPRLIKFPQIYL